MSLELSGITVRYGAVEAVAGVDLSVGDGEVVALLGPSGCGKSTLLRAVAGLEAPSAGTVAWDGVDLAGTPVHRRGFGLVFQDGQLFPHRDVAGNVAFGLRMRGVEREARRKRVDELLELVGLAGYRGRRVTELSGGEQQRVALARALAPRPRLLLLDEPLSALDRALRESLAVDLARLLREAGATALVVTHDHDEAFTLADRVAVMRAGRIRQVGPPAQVWRSPVDVAVARFLGCGKVLPAGVAERLVGVPARVGLRSTALRVTPDGPLEAEVLERVHRRDHVRLLVRLVDAGGVLSGGAAVDGGTGGPGSGGAGSSDAGSGGAEPDHAEPDHAAPDHAAPDHAAPDHAAPGRTGPGRVEPGRVEPGAGTAGSGGAAAGIAGSGGPAAGGPASDGVGVGGAASGGAAVDGGSGGAAAGGPAAGGGGSGAGGEADEFEAVAPIADPPAPGDRVRLAVDPDGVAVIG
ncbi:hypothetical protein GCM10009660_09530 [Catellatospora bangladeshensis]|uniref:Thiamine transport system ATP-binding protein n=1 Tax=Saccharothrix algeriensis TaxID=173560 RepID=A0ABS2S649_9PSEU|nr:thiamine transport system ATP-binding protein [Saccharothrix algeriensis]